MVIALVPVRCGSQSIPFKNIKPINGKPLVFWILNALNESRKVDHIFVSTDCHEIKEVVQDFNLTKVEIVDRAAENATDTSSTESVMLEFLSKNPFDDETTFILAQATSPIINSDDFDEAITKYEDEKVDSLLSCALVKKFFWDENGPVNYNYLNRPRTQDFKGSYVENGAFYINSVKNILESKNRLGGKIAIYEMPEYTSQELDEPEDWAVVESLMKRYMPIYTGIDGSKKKVKLFLSDVDGTLTDAGMYYAENGDELKKFNTHDGKGFERLRLAGVKTGFLTSENTNIVKKRADKIKVDYLHQGVSNASKLETAREIIQKENLSFEEVAYIGDDINCLELLEEVGFCACPSNAVKEIKSIKNIIQLKKSGGDGAVREFIDLLFEEGYISI